MPIEDIVRWLRSARDNVHGAAERLRSTAAKPPRGERSVWVSDLCQHFDEFAVRVRERLDDEEREGYLTPIVECRPSLAGQLELLKKEHTELLQLVDGVHEAVRALSPKDNLLIRDCCKRIEDLLGWLERHDEHENHLVLYVIAQGDEARA